MCKSMMDAGACSAEPYEAALRLLEDSIQVENIYGSQHLGLIHKRSVARSRRLIVITHEKRLRFSLQ